MTIWGDDLKFEDGYWTLPDGTSSPNKVHAFWFGELKFCGCGDPVQALTLLRDVLAAYDIDDSNSKWAAIDILLPPKAPLALHYRYWLDQIELTEHGGSVYGGWLSGKGKSVLALLQASDLNDVNADF